MKDSNLRFPRSKQGGIAASPMRDKIGNATESRTPLYGMKTRYPNR